MQLGERTWTEIPDLAAKVVVVPLGSLEQHGHHLPLLTDSLIGAEIARRAEAELAGEALFLPMLWIGSSHHHTAYPGTVSLSQEVYVTMLIDLLESLIRSGFRRIVLFNAHGGNINPAQAALYDVQVRHRQDKPDLWLVLATWSTLAAEQIAALDELADKQVTHACELETSMVLRLRPDLVHMDVARGTASPLISAFYCPDDSVPSRVTVIRMFEQITPTGALGRPELGTPEKGEALFETAAREAAAFLREFATWTPMIPQ